MLGLKRFIFYIAFVIAFSFLMGLIVNLVILSIKYIEKVNSHEITLCSGLKVVIGRAHSKEFKKGFFKWRMWFDN